ncbi:hypothetical protein [uncultured Marinobacter sp.]|nr:hypothetical protein [uncultured Marinobacter sp.]
MQIDDLETDITDIGTAYLYAEGSAHLIRVRGMEFGTMAGQFEPLTE